ncbi:unnamed protein product, partial [Ascophyllum nodosum]
MTHFRLIPRRDDAAGQEVIRDALSRRSAASGRKERSKSKAGSTARNSGNASEILTEDETPKISFSDVGDKVSSSICTKDGVAGNESSRKRQLTNKIDQNPSAKSAKSKAGSTASNNDNAPKILPVHETPKISFSDKDDTVNDDFIDEVDQLVVDGTGRGEDRSDDDFIDDVDQLVVDGTSRGGDRSASSGDDASNSKQRRYLNENAQVTLLRTIESMRKDARRGGLKTEAEVLRTFKESVCSAGHSMIKHVNVASKAETLLRGVSSVFVLVPCSCEGGSDLGTLVSDIDLRDQRKNVYVYVGGKNKGSLFDLVHQREET